MLQEMLDLEPKGVVDDVFVPSPASPSEFMLGPCFRTEFPSKLTSFYPLVKGEKLLLHLSGPDLSRSKTLKTWPTVNKAWTDWVDRVERGKGELWKSAGIYEAI
ncbi:unnamed protein product [Ilex paraguariensis]|uniref:Uncharacterized protein n=1 Tax=Ilex paraguariensis TaxID=185542 RepID=A0ABC8TFD1_9AQUA